MHEHAHGHDVAAAHAHDPAHAHGHDSTHAHRHDSAHAHGQAPAVDDPRELVRLPEPMQRHLMRNMREHLHTVQEITQALARNATDEAAGMAEQRLGMSSLQAHNAELFARFLPKGMQEIGTGMHRAASRFAVAAQNAAATSDVRPALGALGEVVQHCVACHARYRLH
jgi:hypothetical protein